MGNTSEKKTGKHICAALLAHVDAGKTTLSEGLLYTAGMLRQLGRVDKKDAFLDTDEMERERGITIFSKQAEIKLPNLSITLLDTPGHVDFSAEMERTLWALDYAILVINGADGVQGHTKTLWQLLEKYKIPAFLFVNKMDQQGTDDKKLMSELKHRLSDNCVRFTETDTESFFDEAAMCAEEALEAFLENGEISDEILKKMIAERKIFPCYFGSALKLTGVAEFLQGFERFTEQKHYKEAFGAKIFKIARDESGGRLTFLKVTGGSLKVKTLLNGKKKNGEDWEEKVNQLRVYSGEKYETRDEVYAGEICAATGLTETYAGEGIGAEEAAVQPYLEPVLNYRVILEDNVDAAQILPYFRRLEEEDPALHVVWSEQYKEILIQVMGEVQTEILTRQMSDRFGVNVSFNTGHIVYKETIAEIAEGVGHFEPLRHYAEVHLLLEPSERGSGLTFETNCSEDCLDKNWQRLILTHLQEKEHKGVLTGAGITDIKITLAAGKAHQKHTEGGDFRQATYRAVRQGLMQAKSVLLEPYYEYRLEVPENVVGRAMTDLERMNAKLEGPVQEGAFFVLTGKVPAVFMQEYAKEVAAYTKGAGKLSVSYGGYGECHNAQEVIENIGYDAEADLGNPASSVFCAHGAGFVVDWQDVPKYMHLESALSSPKKKNESREHEVRAVSYEAEEWIEPEEIDAILAKTFRANQKSTESSKKGWKKKKVISAPTEFSASSYKKIPDGEEYLLVDGYNIIFAWEELSELAKTNIDSARGKLLDIMCNYQGIRACQIIVVFDAYKVEGHTTEYFDYQNIHVVYTKEAETADAYIERFAHENSRKYRVTVATSDGLEQVIIRGAGALLLSARELYTAVKESNQKLIEEHTPKTLGTKAYLLDSLSEETAKKLRNLQ